MPEPHGHARPPGTPGIYLVARCPIHGLHGERETCFECGGPVEQVHMVEVGGDIAGPGGPHDPGAVIFDTRGALLTDYTTLARLDTPDPDELVAAILLEGRINRTTERAKVLVLTNEDGLAAIVSECLGMLGRAGGPFLERLRQRLVELDTAGLLAPKPEEPDGSD